MRKKKFKKPEIHTVGQLEDYISTVHETPIENLTVVTTGERLRIKYEFNVQMKPGN